MTGDSHMTTDDTMTLTLMQISGLIDTAINTIRSRSKREAWPSCGATIINHNETKLYAVADLPKDIREKVECAQQEQTTHMNREVALTVIGHTLPLEAKSVTPAPQKDTRVVSINAVPVTAIPERAKKIGLARMDLLRTWEGFRGRFDSLATGDSEFERWYKTGHGAPHLHEILGDVSAKTLSRWKKDLAGSNDWRNLVPNYKWSGMVLQTTLEPNVRKIFERFMLDPRRSNISQCIFWTREALHVQGIECDASDSVFYRYADWFEKTHNDVWVFRREGSKALWDKVLHYIKRDPGVLNVGDCFVADGHRLNLMIINPFTGKPCRATMIAYLDWKSYDLAGYEIMIEENTQCIASALRHGMLKLGKRPGFCYQDNGRAFRSKYFTNSPSFEESGFSGLFGRFNIVPVYSLPYNARAKVVERWWGIFNESFERLIPSYVGASIDDKPAYLKRNEKFHQALRGDYTPQIWELVDMIDQWLHIWSSRNECPHVKGKSIRQVFDEGRGEGIDADELDDLMMETKVTKIYQNGVRLWGGYYWHEALYGKRYDDIIVRYSIFDQKRVKLYLPNGVFLCSAERAEEMHPLVNYLGSQAEKDRYKNVVELRGRLRKSTIDRSKQVEEAPLPLAVNGTAGAIGRSPDTFSSAIQPGALMVQQARESENTIEALRGEIDLSQMMPEERRTADIKLFECDLDDNE